MAEQALERPTPWAGRAREMEAENNGGWSDYAAWEEWIDSEINKPCCFGGGPDCTCHGCTAARTWNNICVHAKTTVYALMVDAVDYALAHRKEAPDA